MIAVRNCPPSEYFIMTIGWIALAGVLCQNLNPIDAGVALFGFVIAELASRIMVIGLDWPQNPGTSSLEREEVLGHVLLRWVLFTISILILAQSHGNWFFEHHQYALICTLSLCLVLALIRLVCTFSAATQKRTLLSARMRNSVVAAGIFGVAQFGPLNSDLVLSLAVAVLLAILVVVSLGFWFSSPTAQDNSTVTAARSEHMLAVLAPLSWRYADVIIMALVLSPQNTLIYLIARGLAQGVSLALNLLSDQIVDPLHSAYCAGNLRHFAAIAARTNLGFLLIGGSASLGALSIGAYMPMVFNLDPVAFRNILFWLVTVQAASVLFGATGVLSSIAQCKRGTILLPLLGAFLFWTTLILMDVNDPLKLAQIFAYTHMLIAAASAVLLGLRFGIWPGITAVLFRQLKLL